MQESTVFENNAFECIFDRFEVHVITVLSSRPGKHQTLAFLLMVDFFKDFLKLHIFRDF